MRATAELVEGQIRVYGNLHTRVEMVCARCLDTVVEEISRDFDLFYRPMTSIAQDEEFHLNLDDTEIAFFEGDGLFLADVLAEQVNLALPMKVICRSDCRGLCSHCGANLNNEECRCEKNCIRPTSCSARPSEAGLVQKAIKRYTIPFHFSCTEPRPANLEEQECLIQNDVTPKRARTSDAPTIIFTRCRYPSVRIATKRNCLIRHVLIAGNTRAVK